MILANLKEKVRQKKLEFLSASDLISSAVKEYGFDYEGQVDKIILDTKNNFVVKADKAAFTYMIFNLIKNALYYLNSNKDGFIKISFNRGENNRLNYNQIIVEDNGPGIPEDKIKYIFDSFYTSGKVDGVGLGLDFCKKAMESFGGKIECNSKINDFTKFILSFPKLSDAEINEFLPNNEGVKLNYFSKNALIFENVDFLEESNHFKNKMKELEVNARFFKEETVFISELKLNYNCDLLLVNVENNEDIIFDLIIRIRKINNEVPIIAYNANLLNEKALMSVGVDEVIIKNQKQILLLERSIAKWSLISKALGDLDAIIDKNSCPKRILLADDDSVSRMVLSKNLQKYGFEIDEVVNGKELKDKLSDENLHYDLVITDVNMPIINGDEAIKSIINFKDNNLRIPVIIYSGDGEKETIHKFLKSGVSDFFVKGDDVKHLIDLARFWTS
jgi:two-component system CAI-1 autoinducer sensor kinase/phosphatase CqsS